MVRGAKTATSDDKDQTVLGKKRQRRRPRKSTQIKDEQDNVNNEYEYGQNDVVKKEQDVMLFFYK